MYIATAFARQILRYFHCGGVSGASAPSAKNAFGAIQTEANRLKIWRIYPKYGSRWAEKPQKT